MNLSGWLGFDRMRSHLLAIGRRRPPDQVIGGHDNPYMLRWFLIPKNRILKIYLHRFLRSDDDRALHDHPWSNASILLEGFYFEHTIAAGGIHHCTFRMAGDVIARRATHAHRISIVPVEVGREHDGAGCTGTLEVWSLFICGPNSRKWGFHCPKGWVPWEQFGEPQDDGHGCE